MNKGNINLLRIRDMLFYLYCFSIHFELWNIFNLNIDFIVTKITISLYLISSILYQNRLPMSKSEIQPLVYIFLIFSIQTIQNFFFIKKIEENLIDMSFLLNMLLLFFIVDHYKKNHNLILKGLKYFVYGGIGLSILILLGIEVDYNLGGRLTIFSGNQNGIGINLAFCLIIILYTLLKNKHLTLENFIFYMFTPIILYYCLQTGSRTALISLIIGIISIFSFINVKSKSIRIKYVSLGAVILFLLWLYANSFDVISSRFSSLIFEGDLSGRDIYWIEIWNIFLENPIWGHGTLELAYKTELIFGYRANPHNLFIEILATSGVIGLILLFLFLFKFYKIALSNRLIDELPLILLTPVLGIAFVGHPLGTKIIWVIFLYSLFLKYKQERFYFKK